MIMMIPIKEGDKIMMMKKKKNIDYKLIRKKKTVKIRRKRI